MFEPLLPGFLDMLVEIRLDRPVDDAELRLICQVNHPCNYVSEVSALKNLTSV